MDETGRRLFVGGKGCGVFIKGSFHGSRNEPLFQTQKHEEAAMTKEEFLEEWSNKLPFSREEMAEAGVDATECSCGCGDFMLVNTKIAKPVHEKTI